MTDLQRSQVDKTMLGHDPARDEQVIAHSARADAILGKVMAGAEFTTPLPLDSGIRRRWRLTLPAGAIALAAAVALLVVALVATATPRAPSSTRRAATSQGAQSGHAPVWRLVSDLSSSWHIQSGSGYDAEAFGPFSCPSSTTCYADDFAARTVQSEIQVTHDGGNSWQEAVLPTTLSDPGAISCVDADACAILGIDTSGDPVFLETTDGGQTWSSHAGPNGLTSVHGTRGLACATAMSCVSVPEEPVGDSAGDVSFVTNDGGDTWQTYPMPAGFSQGPGALQCPTASICVVSGTSQSSSGSTFGEIAYSTNGGSSWLRATVPTGRSAWRLSCGSASDCLTISQISGSGSSEVLRSSDGGKTWAPTTASGLPRGFVTSVSCADASDCWTGGMATAAGSTSAAGAIAGGFLASTSDGGQSFEEAVLPPSIGVVLNVSCPTATNCYAIAVSQKSQSIVLLAYGPDSVDTAP